MQIDNLTIVEKNYLERLESHYKNSMFEWLWWLQIQDIENLDVMLPSLVKYLQDAWLILKEQRTYELEHDKSMQIVGWMNILRQLASSLEQGKLNTYRETFQKHKESLQK